MRGQRQVFARGLALALIKKLTLEGDEIWVRFFDSRLHETVKIARSRPGARCRTCCRSAASAAATTARCFASCSSRSRGCAASRSGRVVVYHHHARPVPHRARADHRAPPAGVPLRHRGPAVAGRAARVRAAARSPPDRAGRRADLAHRPPAPRARHRDRRDRGRAPRDASRAPREGASDGAPHVQLDRVDRGSGRGVGPAGQVERGRARTIAS